MLPGVLLAATFVVAGAGTANALTNSEIANYKGADRQKVLVAGAKKEGEVTWYTTLIVDQAGGPIKAAFEKKYPFLKVNMIRANTSKIMQRALAEIRSKSVRVDVIGISGSFAAAMKKANQALPFWSPQADVFPAQYKDPERTWVAVRTSWQGIGWNTNLVKNSQAPKTWEALLDSKWKGKIIWTKSSTTGAPRLITHLRKIWGEKKALDYFTKLKRQDVRTVPGSVRTALDLIAAGDHSIGASMAMHHIPISAGKGAPVHGASPEPQLCRSGVVTLIKGSPHPYAGMLLTDFILDPKGGQRVLRKAKYNPAHPKVDALPEMQWIRATENGKKEVCQSPSEVHKMTPKSQKIYKQMFR